MSNDAFRLPFEEDERVSNVLLSLPSQSCLKYKPIEESIFFDCNKDNDSKQDDRTLFVKRSHSFQEALSLSLSTSDIANIVHLRGNGSVSPVISNIQTNVQDSVLHQVLDETKQQPVVQPVLPQRDSLSSERSDEYVCRICHEGEDVGQLVSPCYCCGSVGLVHLSCLEQWLGASKTSHCELCKYEFTLIRLPCPMKEMCRPVWFGRILSRQVESNTEFLQNPPSPRHRNNLICDLVCFVVLTPVTASSLYACIRGMKHYVQLQDAGWKQQGMLVLIVALTFMYLAWLVVVIQYYYSYCKRWRKQNEIVKVTHTSPTKNERTLHSPRSASCKFDHLNMPLLPASASNRENQHHSLVPNMCQLQPILKYSAPLKASSWQSSLQDCRVDVGSCHWLESTSHDRVQVGSHTRHETYV